MAGLRPLSLARNVAKNAGAALGLRGLLHSGAYGMDGDLAAVLGVLDRLAPPLADLDLRAEGLRVMELGPGRTPELLGALILAGAETGSGLDTRLQLTELARRSEHYEPLAAALADAQAGAFLDSLGATPDGVRARMQALRAGPWPVEFRRTPGSTIPAANGSVDLLLSKSVLEHVSVDAVPALVDETYRVLRPGGGAVHMIDLRDHLWIDGDERVTGDWLDALRYSPLVVPAAVLAPIDVHQPAARTALAQRVRARGLCRGGLARDAVPAPGGLRPEPVARALAGPAAGDARDRIPLRRTETLKAPFARGTGQEYARESRHA